MTVDKDGNITLNGVEAQLNDPEHNTRVYITEQAGVLTFRVFVKEVEFDWQKAQKAYVTFRERCQFTMTKEQYESLGQRMFK